MLLVFLALLREPGAEGATRVPPAALGRVPVLDRAPEVKTIRRKLAGLASAGRAADWQLAIARHHAAARPGTLGFLCIDGHTRAYFGTRDVQKMHVARLKFPGPATEETWVTDNRGDPLLVVLAEPSSSLAAQIKTLLPDLRAITGPDAPRRGTGGSHDDPDPGSPAGTPAEAQVPACRCRPANAAVIRSGWIWYAARGSAPDCRVSSRMCGACRG